MAEPIFNSEELFSGQLKNVIFTVISRCELATLQTMIHKIDTKAFLTVMDTNEILGEGFKSLEEKTKVN